MLKNYKEQGLKFIVMFTLGVLMISPSKAEPPEEMVLNISNMSTFHDDVTDVKFECSIKGWYIDTTGSEVEGVVARGTTIAPKPGPTEIISINFEPTVDNFELIETLDYVCEVYVRDAEDEEQGWVGVSAASNTPDIGRIEKGGSSGTVMSALGRTVTVRGRLRGSD